MVASKDALLYRIVALNRERAAEEAAGHVRWLRPEFQNPDDRAAVPAAVAELDHGEAAAAAAKLDWLRALPQQMAALCEAGEAGPADIARRFCRARATSVAPLDTLAALGHATSLADGCFEASLGLTGGSKAPSRPWSADLRRPPRRAGFQAPTSNDDSRGNWDGVLPYQPALQPWIKAIVIAWSKVYYIHIPLSFEQRRWL
jgi:hypothetical protein